jgi:RHH-type proline utilization regulon transcriptional repressor/proline dehydrogenase/delta 1-pyrroline-5-carboxylate dehydrogenase
MVLLMKDHTLRTRLLRFVDVLAALPSDSGGKHAASLFREYSQADFRHLPTLVRLALGAARSTLFPAPLLDRLARRFTRLMASRFIITPGPDAVAGSVERLQRLGRYPSFDLLGEEVVSEEEARQYRQGYLDLLEHLGRHPLARQRTPGGGPSLEVSLKLSSLTPQFNPADPDGTLEGVGPALEEICQTARERGIGVTVDAEQYAYRDLTWFIFSHLIANGGPLGQWPDIGMVVQAYLRDAQEHAREVLAFARQRGHPFRVRLVKGAYWDYEVITAEQNGWPVPVFCDKGSTDLNFQGITQLFLESPPYVRLAIASHNIRAHAYAEAVREAVGLALGAVEHQTLYRTLESLSRALPRMGWVARDYIPTGELIPGMAYLVRRILENTSQVGFLTRTRLREDVEVLLRPPEPGEEDLTYRRMPDSTGFENTPVARLFDAKERQGFRQTLQETRARWGRTYALHLGGQGQETARLVPSISPSHPDPSHPVGWVHQAGREEVEQAVALVNQAAPAWARRSLVERAAIGLRAAELLREGKAEMAAWVVHEGGRPWVEALADVEEAIDHIAWNSRQVERLARLMEAEFRPRGVVACISPWNFPAALPAGMVSAALVAGNAVILKSAEATPIVAQKLVDLFHQAGVPTEALIHLPGPGETVGAGLVESPDVDMVAFTGSKAVGLQIYRICGAVALRKGGIKRAVTEMGSKNPILVFPDADLDEAVLGILDSAFGHAGQKCSACSRVLVHQEIYPRLVQRLTEAARCMPVGPADHPGTVINPVINDEAWRRILAYGEVARQEGRVLLDLLEYPNQNGLLLGPMLLEVDPSKADRLRVTQEEIFGPVLALLPFTSEGEAVSIANNTPYGLTLGIFSRSPSTVARMIKACQAGNIYVNRGITGARVGIEPFGGLRLSGTGPKAGSEEYILAFLTRRSAFRQDQPRAPIQEHGASGSYGDAAVTSLQDLEVWEETLLAKRLSCLQRALSLLQEERGDLEQAIAAWKPLALGEADHILATLSAVLRAAPEIAEPQPSIKIPGQDNYIRWDTPRGVGIIAVDEGSNAATLAGLIWGTLLAGNGVLVAAYGAVGPVGRALVDVLWRAGVPGEVLALAKEGTPLEELAAQRVHFAAVDLSLESTRSLYRALAITDEEVGQRWLKALISMADSLRPSEPGFLRLFAHPKVVAVQSLRHGANLELV